MLPNANYLRYTDLRLSTCLQTFYTRNYIDLHKITYKYLHLREGSRVLYFLLDARKFTTICWELSQSLHLSFLVAIIHLKDVYIQVRPPGF